MRYKIDGLLKMTEEYQYKNGCLHNTVTSHAVDVSFSGNTQSEVINALLRFLAVEKDAIEVNACDEDGRVDVSILETAEGRVAIETEINKWKDGSLKLYLANYSGCMEKCERVKINLEEKIK